MEKSGDRASVVVGVGLLDIDVYYFVFTFHDYKDIIIIIEANIVKKETKHYIY